VLKKNNADILGEVPTASAINPGLVHFWAECSIKTQILLVSMLMMMPMIFNDFATYGPYWAFLRTRIYVSRYVCEPSFIGKQ
jgi:hypothetical protein